MLGSAELGARLGAQFGAQLGIDWSLGTRDSAWLGSGFSSAHLLDMVLGIGSGLGSAQLGSPARLEARGSAQDSALSWDRSPAWLISAREIL